MNKIKKFIIFCIVIGSLFSQETYIDSTNIKNPSIAWKLGFIPGLGQAYNGKWIKSGIFITTQFYAMDNYIRLKEEGNITKRNTYAWWVLGLYFYGILDAYVDAHLSSFPIKYNNIEKEKELVEITPDTLKVKVD